MDFFEQFASALPDFLPTLAAIAGVLLVLLIANWILLKRKHGLGEESRYPRRIAMLLLTGIGVVLVFLALPVGDGTRNQLLGLLGLLLTAVIALSATTFVANAMAGIMLRTVRSFKPGDFVRVGEQFGRVTERGLFHVEIQTEDRDLTTIPNLYMISHPITVVRTSGTIVTATVSLGYNNPHPLIETLLIRAAESAKLKDPFVRVLDLGDFSVTYRVAGFLSEVKQLLTARSNLRKMMLDHLHSSGVEIVSPTFMNQRPAREDTAVFPPESYLKSLRSKEDDHIPEELIFDKADEAEKIEDLKAEQERLSKKIKELETHLKETQGDERAMLEKEIERFRSRIESISQTITNEEEIKDD